MKVLVTGANGFVGKNLTLALKEIMIGNDKTRPNLHIENVFCFDVNDDFSKLPEYCSQCDFVFNLAGINRPTDESEYMKGNFGFLSNLLKLLARYKRIVPVMLSSSIQASLLGRFQNSPYGKSKYAAEQLLMSYGKQFNVRTLIYRFPNLFGKWCRPNYNSAISTFCYNYAHNMPIQVNDPNTELELLYIDDLVQEMLDALEGKEHKCIYNGLDIVPNPNGNYCYAPVTHKVTLGQIVKCLDWIKYQPQTLLVPEMKNNSFMKKLYSTYLSYLPQEKAIFDLKQNVDNRGSFTELLKTVSGGQFSVNVSKPGITKGQHFHNSKWEFFIVVKGDALIQERNVATNELYQYKVSGNRPQAVHMLPGFTHNIINLSKTEDLITLIWANELFDKNRPDTFFEEV